MNPDREQKWVEKARRDPQAFKQLYDHYFPRLYAYVSYRVGRAQDAEDLVAETFLKVAEEIGHFEWRHEGSFAAWLFCIAHNLISNFYRQGQRRKEPLPLEELPELQASTLLPEEAVLQKEKFAYLRRLIGTLSPRRQEVITLKFFGGLRNREIAEVLGLDERTVASYLCRGLEDLHRKCVDRSDRKK
ncbi:MAG: RNA polymerase sigma factor [Chloroflexota bacterium]|nr:RNA polymerase sigma factor [Chloroflexota bacterium]